MMRFRSLPTSVVFATVLALLPVSVSAVDVQPAMWEGIVTFCEGSVTLVRDGRVYVVKRGAGLRDGDTLDAGSHGEFSILLNNGPAITASQQSKLRIDRFPRRWDVALQSGQMRIVHDGKSALSVAAGDHEVLVQRAILQLGQQGYETQLELIAGSMLLRSSTESVQRVSGPTSFVCHGGQYRRVHRIDWEFPSSDIRLAAAMQTAPALQPPSSTNPSNGLNSNFSGTNPTTNPSATDRPAAADSAESALNERNPQANDDENDERRPLAQDPSLASTRGGGDDNIFSDTATSVTTNTFGGSSSLSLGSLSSSTGSFTSGGLFGDANQQTFQGQVDGNVGEFLGGSPFPGAIHLVTGETRLPFNDVQLSTSEFAGLFASSPTRFYSIGVGDAPTGQVITNFFTGTSAKPETIDVPRFNVHLIQLDQYNISDPAQGALDSNIGLTGLIGPNPQGPTIVGTTPLVDERAQLNQSATFALGEFLVSNDGPNGISFSIRRSDQDRLIVKDPSGNDANDKVTPNTDVNFVDAVDPRFLAQSPSVKVPDSVANTGTGISELNLLRRAALTTLVADQLQDYSRRTGQTRFVVDGKIVDISGFQP